MLMSHQELSRLVDCKGFDLPSLMDSFLEYHCQRGVSRISNELLERLHPDDMMCRVRMNTTIVSPLQLSDVKQPY
jgi:hypothetical protein